MLVRSLVLGLLVVSCSGSEFSSQQRSGGTGGGDAGSAGQGGSDSSGGTGGTSGGASGASGSSGAGGSAQCASQAQACEGRECGAVSNNCGGEIDCGQCRGLRECSDEGLCVPSCDAAGFECGTHLVDGEETNCGECPEVDGFVGVCGRFDTGRCSYCRNTEQFCGDPAAPELWQFWVECEVTPKLGCWENQDNTWCCPP